jgi:hypothetical protein
MEWWTRGKTGISTDELQRRGLRRRVRSDEAGFAREGRDDFGIARVEGAGPEPTGDLGESVRGVRATSPPHTLDDSRLVHGEGTAFEGIALASLESRLK